MKTNTHFSSHLAQFFLQLEMFQTKVLVEIKIHILCSVTFFSENSAVYEIMWKNLVDLDRLQMTVRRMCISCWMPRATDTHSQYVILIAFPIQPCLHQHASVLHYTILAVLFFQYRRLFEDRNAKRIVKNS